jgi:prepilin-type N-terminal cleavage/methylation domain-containing protein
VSDNTKGFTLTELLIAVSLGGLLAVVVLSISMFFFSDIMRSHASAQMTQESSNLLRLMVEDVRVATGIQTTNLIADSNNPTGWNTSNEDHILIVAVPALDSDNEFIINVSAGEPYFNEFVYFSDENRLFRRTLADTAAPGNSSVTTCPEATSSPSCPPDVELSQNYEDITFVFYDQDNMVTTDTFATRSLKINVDLIRQVFGNTITATNQTRITMRNPR